MKSGMARITYLYPMLGNSFYVGQIFDWHVGAIEGFTVLEAQEHLEKWRPGTIALKVEFQPDPPAPPDELKLGDRLVCRSPIDRGQRTLSEGSKWRVVAMHLDGKYGDVEEVILTLEEIITLPLERTWRYAFTEADILEKFYRERETGNG